MQRATKALATLVQVGQADDDINPDVTAADMSLLFDLPAEIEGQRVIFEFEGVYRDAVVHVNGDYAGQRPSGRIRLDHSLRKTPEVRSRRRRRTGPDPLPRRLRRERLLGTR